MALTKEQIDKKTAELKQFIAANKDTKGPLMPIMQKAQELFGYLSLETQELIADSLDIPVSEVYGVATFYSQFSLRPKGENVVSVCTGTACYVKGAQAVLERSRTCWASRPAKRPRTASLPFRTRAASAAAGLRR